MSNELRGLVAKWRGRANWTNGYAAAADELEALLAQPEAAAYPECSGDPSDCPENEGFGCCKGKPEAAGALAGEAVECHASATGKHTEYTGNGSSGWCEWCSERINDAPTALSAAPVAAQQPAEYADADALIAHLDSLCDESDEKWGVAQAAIAGIRAAQQPAVVGDGVTRYEAEQFLVAYHAAVWDAAQSEHPDYEYAGRGLAKTFLARFGEPT